METITTSRFFILVGCFGCVWAYLGTQFLVTCPDSRVITVNTEYLLYITAPDTSATVIVDTPLLGSQVFSGLVSQGDVREISLSTTYLISGTTTSSYTIVINATADVSVYLVLKNAGDGYMALPVDALGTEYYVVTYCEQPGNNPCQFTVTAAEPSTVIEINLSIQDPEGFVNLTDVIYRSGDIISETLIQYQTIQIQCKYDLTGTSVVSSRPVAVIGGGSGSTVGYGAVNGVLLEQYPPVSAYGKEVVTIPSQFVDSPKGDYYRILTAKPLTSVSIGGRNRKLITKAGDWFQTNVSDITLITSDKPILVSRVTLSSRELTSQERPTLMTLVPTEQFLSKNTKVLLPGSSTPNNKVILVSKKPNNVFIEIGGNLQDFGWNTVAGNPSLVVKYHTTSSFSAQLINSPQESFTAYYQTNADRYSTSYIAGMKFEVTNAPCVATLPSDGDTVDNDCDGLIDEDFCPFDMDPASPSAVGKDCELFVTGERDSYGRRFVITLPHHSDEDNPEDDISLVFSSLTSDIISVTIITPITNIINSSITFQGTYILSLPPSIEVNGNGIFNLSILIESSHEISAYATNIKKRPRFSAGATRFIPTESLGNEYYVITVCDKPEYSCQVTVAAVHPTTEIKVYVYLKDSTKTLNYEGKDYSTGEVIQVSLSQYQVLQILSPNDFTGTRILADKPVSVFSGSNMTEFKINQQADQMMEQLFPLQSWGWEFVVLHAPGRLGTSCYFGDACFDAIRVIAFEGNTRVAVTNGTAESTYLLDHPGAWVNFDLQNEAAYITSTKAVSVSQLLTDGVSGDAGLLNVISVSQYTNSDNLRIMPAISTITFTNYLLLTTRTDFTPYVRVNGNPVSGHWDIVTDGMSYRQMIVTDDETLVSTVNNSVRVSGYMYANAQGGQFLSYIFSMASLFLPINKPCEITVAAAGDEIDNDCDGSIDEERCNEASPQDGDFDGMFNEDCAFVSVSSSIESSSTEASSSLDGTESQLSTSFSDVVTLSQSQAMASDHSTLFSNSIFDTSSPTQTTVDMSTDVTTGIDASWQTQTTIDIWTEVTTGIDTSSQIQTTPDISAEVTTGIVQSPADSSTGGATTALTSTAGVITTSSSMDNVSLGFNSSSIFVMTSGDSVCSCGCITWAITTDLESESLVEVTESIKQELTVDAKEVSQTKRKFISVPDPRISAQTVGYFGVATITSIFVGIFILDAGALFKDIVALVQACKEFAAK